MVPVTLISPTGRCVTTVALVDSGADWCLFPAKWLRRLGLRLKAGREGYLRGIKQTDGSIRCYYHRLTLQVGSTTKVNCEVGFSSEIGDDIYDQLVGRIAVFDRLQFAFRQKRGILYVQPESP